MQVLKKYYKCIQLCSEVDCHNWNALLRLGRAGYQFYSHNDIIYCYLYTIFDWKLFRWFFSCLNNDVCYRKGYLSTFAFSATCANICRIDSTVCFRWARPLLISVFTSHSWPNRTKLITSSLSMSCKIINPIIFSYSTIKTINKTPMSVNVYTYLY